jgi:hypothetical protein
LGIGGVPAGFVNGEKMRRHDMESLAAATDGEFLAGEDKPLPGRLSRGGLYARPDRVPVSENRSI